MKGLHSREFIIEKQSPLQVTHYWPLLLLVSFMNLREESRFELQLREGSKKALYFMRQNYSVIGIL